MSNWIALKDHPSALDPTAILVSGSRERLSIFRVRGGYVAALDGMAAPRLFASESDARCAAIEAAGR